jgi:16S rRNA (guanine(966)-N(2))-methyltransferase RsmD
MRIIAGDAKGRRLFSPSGRDTRPTSDLVKGSLFNILGNRVLDAKVLDLFAGTGNLGVEAISRGALSCVFIDNSRESIKIVHQNINMLKYSQFCEVYDNDSIDALRILSRRNLKFNIIFIDPPYHKDIIPQCLKKIGELGLLENKGIIAAEHDIKDVLPDEMAGLAMVRRVSYGDTAMSFYMGSA